jgi:HTH-type transcriptional regulator/antitoxin HigA
MSVMKKITSEVEYKEVMQRINALMAKGSENVNKEELNEIRKLAEAAQQYEQSKLIKLSTNS